MHYSWSIVVCNSSINIMETYKDVLLIGENYIKSNSNIDFNMAGNYLFPAIYNAQFVELQSIIGDCLLSTLQQKVFDDELDLAENVYYKDLLDNYIQIYLLHQVLTDIIIPIAYKMSNGGLMIYEDERLHSASNAEINLVREYYQNKANVYKKRLQDYLCKNKSKYPELGECCNTNLHSSTPSGIWLGGYRSKIVPKGCCND